MNRLSLYSQLEGGQQPPASKMNVSANDILDEEQETGDWKQRQANLDRSFDIAANYQRERQKAQTRQGAPSAEPLSQHPFEKLNSKGGY